MRVLWLSPVCLNDRNEGSGTWLRALAPRLISSGQVVLGNITVAPVSSITRLDYGEISQWLVSGNHNSIRNVLPSQSVIDDIRDAAKEFRPDIIHIWGTEYFWGLLTARKQLHYPALLEIQGLKGPYSRLFTGGLCFREILACTGIKEILGRSTILQNKKAFSEWARFENEIIAKHANITTQSRWVEAWIRYINPSCNLYHTELILRDAFYESEPWTPPENFNIFTSAAYSAPFKGLHDAIRATAILRDRIPSVRLRIAGGHQKKGLSKSGYVSWINRLIRKYDLYKNIEWLGLISENEITEELLNCSVALVPSHVETYCVAFAEAMKLGVPIVTSFSGGTAWLGRDEETTLFYPAGDEVMCAYQLERLLTDQDLAVRLSKKGREIADQRNDPDKIILNQLNIYKEVLKKLDTLA